MGTRLSPKTRNKLAHYSSDDMPTSLGFSFFEKDGWIFAMWLLGDMPLFVERYDSEFSAQARNEWRFNGVVS